MDNREKLEELFDRALALPSEQREAFLDEACAADAALREELDTLLAHYKEAPAFFESLADAVLPPPSMEQPPSGAEIDRHGLAGRTVSQHGLVGQTVSHYHILEKLGGGAMGVVYKARDLKLQRAVALKFLTPVLSASEEAKTRFIHEAKAASALDHPNIATVHEIGETGDGQLFIAMAYYRGQTLKKKIAEGPLPLCHTLDYSVQIARGLAQAHAQDIIHRDVKPANLMVTDDGMVKIVDFGIAKIAGIRLTKTGSTLGTIAYMSPEQAQGQDVDHRTDIWSFGAVLFEALTGILPFKGDYDQATIYAILNEEPDWEALHATKAPAIMQAIVKKALQKNRNSRFQSFTEILEELTKAGGITVRSVRAPRFITLPRVFLAGMTLAIILLTLWLSKSARPVSLQALNQVIVANIDNNTDEVLFDHSLTEALRVTLRQSAYINILPPHRIASALERMQLPADQPLDSAAIMLEVAQREGARVVIAGSIDRLGENYILTSKIVDPATAEVIRLRRVEVARIEDVLSGMDKLARNLRKDLGESLSQISVSSAPLQDVTTPSLKALELYSRSTIAIESGNYEEANRLLEQAIALDSSFAMAVSALAYGYRKTGNYERALYYHNRVLPLLGRVSDRERLAMLVTYYGPSFEMDNAAALKYAKQWTLLYPDDAIGHAYLAHMAMFVGDYDTAVRENLRALSLDSSNAGLDSSRAGIYYNNSGFASALSGNADEALAYFRKSKRLRPSYLAIDGYIAQALWIKSDIDSAEATFKSILPEEKASPLRIAKTHAHLAALYHFQGRLQQALVQIERGRKVSYDANRPQDAAYFQYLTGEIAAERGHNEEFVNAMSEAIRLSTVPFLELALAGASLARHGYVKEAELALAGLRSAESLDPHFVKRRPSMEHLIRGEIALVSEEPEKAANHFSQVEELRRGDPLYLLAQRQLGKSRAQLSDTTAMLMYLNLLDRRGEICMAYLSSERDGGVWTGQLWPEVHFELGKLYWERRDTSNAMYHLNAASTNWQKGDGDFLKAREVRQLLSYLVAADVARVH